MFRFRRHADLAALDAFCRTVQAVADDPEKPDPVKLELLDELAGQLARAEWQALPAFALPLGRLLAKGRCRPADARIFLAAMRREVEAAPFPTLASLLAHAEASAASRGRMRLVLAGLAPDSAADAFFTAAQLLDYVAGMGRCAVSLGRIRFPQDWLGELGVTPQMLALPRSRPEVTQLKHWLLRIVEERIARSRGPVKGLKALEAWARALSDSDPLMQRIEAPPALRRVVPGW